MRLHATDTAIARAPRQKNPLRPLHLRARRVKPGRRDPDRTAEILRNRLHATDAASAFYSKTSPIFTISTSSAFSGKGKLWMSLSSSRTESGFFVG